MSTIKVGAKSLSFIDDSIGCAEEDDDEEGVEEVARNTVGSSSTPLALEALRANEE